MFSTATPSQEDDKESKNKNLGFSNDQQDESDSDTPIPGSSGINNHSSELTLKKEKGFGFKIPETLKILATTKQMDKIKLKLSLGDQTYSNKSNHTPTTQHDEKDIKDIMGKLSLETLQNLEKLKNEMYSDDDDDEIEIEQIRKNSPQSSSPLDASININQTTKAINPTENNADAQKANREKEQTIDIYADKNQSAMFPPNNEPKSENPSKTLIQASRQKNDYGSNLNEQGGGETPNNQNTSTGICCCTLL